MDEDTQEHLRDARGYSESEGITGDAVVTIRANASLVEALINEISLMREEIRRLTEEITTGITRV